MKTGRPTKLTKKLKEQIYQLAEIYPHDTKICKALSIPKSTWAGWKTKFSDFSDQLIAIRKVSVTEVIPSIYKRAKGYTYTERTEEWDPKSKAYKVTKKVKKHVPGNPAAQKLLLNLLGDEYADRQEHTIKGGVVLLPDKKAVDEWKPN